MASYKIPENCLYTREDTWVRRENDGVIRMGVTDYAQQKLKKIEYLSLPEEDETVKQFEALGEIESMKSLAELMAPVTGNAAGVNEEAIERPEVINLSELAPEITVGCLRTEIIAAAEMTYGLTANERVDVAALGRKSKIKWGRTAGTSALT